MNRDELIKEYHETLKRQKLSVRRSDSKKYFDLLIDILSHNITSGRHVTISDFGTFSSKLRSFKSIMLKSDSSTEKWVIKFLPSRTIKNKINNVKTKT
jgi:nucleoid DNA-binding protein